ncbi:V-type proton ATPase 116 kDa subunit a [Drosophila innubila]|uniref:V-type proton ATPase 116 kDa subunit a n=1 Tax=Drosophila innubila TaxID=198719 RepID=UPI00148BF8E4|nr:V-type proton ATPase 116 kDa subunit a [Drosophila innubila]
MAKAFFCSENMELAQLLVHEDNAFNCLVEVGHTGGLQFNNVYDEDRLLNGMYTHKVYQCSELLRYVEFLESQMPSQDIYPTYYDKVDVEERPRESQIPLYDMQLRQMNEEMRSVMEHYTTLERRHNYLEEKRYAIQKAQKMLTSDGSHGAQLLYAEENLKEILKDTSDGSPFSSHLNYILGSINVEKFPVFELMLYRLFGRNLLVRRAEMPEKVYEQIGHRRLLVHKFVVLLMTISVNIRPKLLKCCAAFHVTIFECPETSTQRLLMINQLERESKDVSFVLSETKSVQKRILLIAARTSYTMRINLNKAMKIYDLLNRLSPVGAQEHQKYLQAECFLPASQLAEVRDALNRGALAEIGEAEGFNPQPLLLLRTRKSRHTPPTYFRLNKFTHGFQNLIDSYGMADYKELNPAPYTIITFPFLFAIMFGDLGHGLILILFACILIFQEKRIEEMQRTARSDNEILNILYAGRYIILLMGIFSVYVGFIYNDVLAMPINVFGSSWSCVYNSSTVRKMSSKFGLDPNNPQFYSGHPYPIGLDPIWKISGEDSITTVNSLKMKLAIILGISQMMFGLVLAAVNCISLNRKCDLFLMVIPQCIFMICLFCYLVFLIFFKWLTYGGLKQTPYNSACAPSVLITFIDMMLMKTTELEVKTCNKGMFPHERMLEYVLVLIAFCAVPILLAGKPIYLTRRQKRLTKEREQRDMNDLQEKGRETLKEMKSSLHYSVGYSVDTEKRESETRSHSVADAVEFDLTEIWIHSGIHTIESVLGSVSHTASYLRLWALSLAHSQLADVLFHMVLTKGISNNLPIYLGVPVLTATFFIWAILTVAILVMMEGLSAFLHTLRLHWVEFQSKFFNGAGEMFRPFYFPPSTIRG